MKSIILISGAVIFLMILFFAMGYLKKLRKAFDHADVKNFSGTDAERIVNAYRTEEGYLKRRTRVWLLTIALEAAVVLTTFGSVYYLANKDRWAAERELAQAQKEQKRLEAEKRKEHERLEAEKRKEQERLEAEKRKEQERLEAEKRKEQERLEAEKRKEQERLEAEKRKEHERLEAEKRKEQERLEAEKRKEQERLEAEKRKEQERLEAEKRKEQERLEAEKRKEQERLEAEKRKEQERLEAEKRKEQNVDFEDALQQDLAMGLTKRESRFKQKKLAEAREAMVAKYEAFLTAKAACVEVLEANGFQGKTADGSVYRQCRKKLLAQKEDYCTKAAQSSVDSYAYQQQVACFDKDISLVETALTCYDHWKGAEQTLHNLQQKTVQGWKDMKKQAFAVIAPWLYFSGFFIVGIGVVVMISAIPDNKVELTLGFFIGIVGVILISLGIPGM